jgi:hypoxanthine phosphoribosyltransferase
MLASSPVVPDEFSAMGGMPIISLPGPDRSGGNRPVRDLTWAEFDRQVQALAREVHTRFRPEAVVGLVHGGVFVGGALASALKVDFFPVRVTRRSRDAGSKATEEMPAELQGKRVLIVDDIASSGDSLEFALKLARAGKVKHLATLALLARPGGYLPDFTGFVTDAFFIFPWDYSTVVRDARFEPDPEKAPPKLTARAKPRAR